MNCTLRSAQVRIRTILNRVKIKKNLTKELLDCIVGYGIWAGPNGQKFRIGTILYRVKKLTKELLDCIVGYGVGPTQMGKWLVLYSD
jgi:hypothetical protein